VTAVRAKAYWNPVISAEGTMAQNARDAAEAEAWHIES
jgi:hypothetical protein